MLTGTELIAKADEMQAQGASKTAIVLACGYVRQDGKAAYTAFYEALLAAKYPNGYPYKEEIEFDSEEEQEEFDRLCKVYPQDAVEIYYEEIGTLDDFENAYIGQYPSEKDFVMEMLESYTYEIPSFICIDYQRTYDEHYDEDYWNEDGYFFRNI